MAVDGSLKFDTKIDSSGFESGVTKIGKLAAKGLAAVGTTFAGASAYAIKVGSDFEAGMSEVAAISGATGEDLQMLTDKAKEMGIETKFSATESAEALKYMAMAGWKTNDMVNSLGGIMDLAAASGEDLGLVSDIVTDSMTAFGLAADKTQKIVGKEGLVKEVSNAAFFADVLAAAASNSNTNVSMMGATFKYVAPLAGSLGYSIEDTALAIGMMANAGIKGEQAGTSLRAILTRLVNPTADSEQAMKDLGISITNTDGTMKDFYTVIQDMRTGFAGLSEEQKASYAAMLGGQEAMSGLLAIVNSSDADFNKLTQAIDESNGAAKEMADTMNDNLKGKITLLGSSLEGLGIAAYEKFAEPMKDAVDSTIRKVSALSREMSSGQLSVSMDKCAKGLAKVAEIALDLATKAIPVLINGFAFVADHGREIVTVAGMAGGALLGMKLQRFAKDHVLKVVQAFQKAQLQIKLFTAANGAAALSQAATNGTLTIGEVIVSALTGKITLATAATTLWNAACSALGGPIGVLITAVSTVAIGIAAYAIATGDSTSKTDENTIATEKLIEEYDELNDKLKDNKKAREDAVETAEAEAGSAEVLMDKLEELSKKENKSNTEKEMMKYYVEELNRIMPDLNLAYDEEKDALNKSTEAIRSNIAAQKDLALAKAYQKSMTKIAEDLAEAEMNLDKISKQNTKNEYAYNEAQKATIETRKAWVKSGSQLYGKEYDAYMAAISAEEKTRSNYEETSTAVDKLKKKIKDLNSEYKERDKYAQKSLKAADIETALSAIVESAKAKGVEVPKALADSIREGSYAVPESIEEMQTLIHYDDMIKSAHESGIEVPKSLADGIAKGVIKPSDAVNKMQSYMSFNTALEKAGIAGKDVPETLKTKIIEGQLKPQEAIDQMQALINFNEALSKSKAAGAKVPQEIQDQILSGKMKPNDAIDQMEKLVEFNSLLKESESAGKKVPEWIKQKILDGKLSPADAVMEMNALMIYEASKSKEGMEQAGYNAIMGFARGISGATFYATDAARSAALQAIEAAQKAQESHSPSHVWRDKIGLMAGKGYAIGITNSKGMITDSVTDLAKSAASTMKKQTSKFPKFTPALMSNLKNAAVMNGMKTFDTSAVSKGESSKIDKSVKYEINQNITSPEPLSPSQMSDQTEAMIHRLEWSL